MRVLQPTDFFSWSQHMWRRTMSAIGRLAAAVEAPSMRASTSGATLRRVPVPRTAGRRWSPGAACIQSALSLPLVGAAAPRARRSAMATQAVAEAQEETFTYQAEVDRLMDLIVNSLYSNRDIFLRELVSNSSDALDKARFKGVQDADYLGDNADFRIRIRGDKDKRTVVIEDNGVGMTRQELVDSLGTIARSGTRKFLEALKESKQAEGNNLIGQFGVGFYSSFLVADRVTVQTKSRDDAKQWVWESAAGSHQYTIREDAAADIGRGTRITLYLKEDCDEYADRARLKSLVGKYSEFISFPIEIWQTKTEYKDEEDVEATKKAQEEENKKAEEEKREPTTVAPVLKNQAVTKEEYQRVNESKPLWAQRSSEVKDEEYKEFFKQTFREFVDPLAWNHFSVEGTYEFKGLIYVPGMAPFEQYGVAEKTRSIRLYVKRVFISDTFDEELIPRWLSFIKGVIDSSDLPLNVSREILQESRMTKAIRKQIVRRAIAMLEGLQEKQEDFKTMWDSFGRNIKLGCVEDQENNKQLAKLLRFASSKTDGAKNELTSLQDYVKRAKEGQDSIFFMAADSRSAAEAAPFVERLTKLGYEVLYLTEPIDEYVVMTLGQFEEKKFVDVTREGLKLPEEEGKEEVVKKAAEELQALISFVTERLKGKVEKVEVSMRLEDTPCVLVTSKTGWSANMERIMRAQAMGDNRAMDFMRGSKILEVNPSSNVIRNINSLVAAGDREQAGQLVDLMFETALFTSGFTVDDKRGYANKVFSMMERAAGGRGSSGGSSSSGGAGSVVTPEVVPESSSGDKEDPWK